MADKTFMSVIATTSNRVKDLAIKDGQLIFVQDLNRIAFDFKSTRVFYNQVTILESETDRLALESPVGGYYFVVDTAVFWEYQEIQNEWIQKSKEPESIKFVGVDEMPELGQAGQLYVSANNGISIWDEETNQYVIVADKTNDVSDSDIEDLFA